MAREFGSINTASPFVDTRTGKLTQYGRGLLLDVFEALSNPGASSDAQSEEALSVASKALQSALEAGIAAGDGTDALTATGKIIEVLGNPEPHADVGDVERRLKQVESAVQYLFFCDEPAPVEVVSGGGGAANVAFGPNFGDETRSNTFEVGAAVSCDSHAIESAFSIGAAISEQSHATELAGLSVGAALTANSHAIESAFSVGAAISSVSTVFTDISPDDDTWLDEANDTTAHGSDTGLEHKGDTAVVADTKITYLAWDLTGVTTGTVSSATITLRTSHDGIGTATYQWEFYSNATQPFVEGTATWAADEPPPGTQRASGSVGSVTTSGTTANISLGSTARANMLGNWVYIRLLGSNLNTTVTFTTNSKEAASNKPVLNMTITT